MRLDKFLQVTGLIKRRTIAHEACKRGLVLVNGVAAKPTREVAAGNVIRLELPRRLLEARLLQDPPASGTISRVRRPEFIEIVRDEARAAPDPLDDWDRES